MPGVRGGAQGDLRVPGVSLAELVLIVLFVLQPLQAQAGEVLKDDIVIWPIAAAGGMTQGAP